MSKRRKRGKKNKQENFTQHILSILRKEHSKAFNYKQIAAKLGHPGRKDIGIDGVIETKDDEIHAYQAKFRQDRNNIPSVILCSSFSRYG